MKYFILGLTLILLFSSFSDTVFGIANERLGLFPNGTFISGTTRISPFNNPEESFYSTAVDIIHPQTGQFANYSGQFAYPNGTRWTGWWNMSYNEYIQPHIINTTHIAVNWPSPESWNGTHWCTVDTTTRWVTNADSRLGWNQSWYFLLIETNVTFGSTIKWSRYTATIIGSEILYIAGKYIDCWVANSTYNERANYDKTTGLLVKYRSFIPNQIDFEATLNATNIPIGKKLSTMIYFNLDPNPAKVGDTLTLKGILVDQFSQPLPNTIVKLYARPLGGSWTYITSLTTHAYGILTWQATIPNVPKGTYIFAAYYPGSTTYQSCYNFAILVVQ